MLSICFGSLLAAASAAPAHGDAKDHEVLVPDALQWQDAPPSLPNGAQVTRREGEPAQDGVDQNGGVLRLRHADPPCGSGVASDRGADAGRHGRAVGLGLRGVLAARGRRTALPRRPAVGPLVRELLGGQAGGHGAEDAPNQQSDRRLDDGDDSDSAT